MDDFLNRYHLSTVNQDQINNLNRPRIPKEIEPGNKIWMKNAEGDQN